MMGNLPERTAFWSDGGDLRLHEICRRFEDAWRAGEQPRLESWLAGHNEVDREKLFLELLTVEKEFHEKIGTRLTADGYRERFPDLLGLIDQAFELPRIAGYELLRLLGRGGMAVVYQARQLSLNRIEALKVILGGDYVSEKARTRFHQEARAVAHLDHPHVVRIYHHGTVNGQPFFSMEYLEGGSLADRLKKGPWPPGEAAAFVKVLAETMDFVHGQGYLHRDLKPANILLTGDGRPKIADFGLAKVLDLNLAAGAGHTNPGDVLGTINYMAPEQAAGDTSVYGKATDVYGLGAILYEMLTGRPPFVGNTWVDVLDQVKRKPALSPVQVRPDLPRDLAQICLNCLEKEPGNRYPSAAALAGDLENFLQHLPIHKPPSIENLETDLYLKNIALAEREWAAGLPQRMTALLSVCPVRLRGWEWHCLQQLGRGRGKILNAHTDAVYSVAFSPDGTRLASAADDQTVRIWDVATGKELWLLRGHADQIYIVCFSPDGQKLAAASQARRIKVWDVRSGELLQDIEGHGDVVVGVAWSLDGTCIASASDDRTVKLWAPDTGRLLRTLAGEFGHGDMVNTVAFSPDSRYLASGSYDQTVKIWDLHTGQLARTLPGHQDFVWTVAYSPDGSLLASAGGDRTIKLWNTRSGQEVFSLTGHTDDIWSLSFHPNEPRLASGSWDNTVRIWDTTTGRETLTLHGHADAVKSVAFHPRDGRLLVSAGDDRVVRLWDADTQQVPAAQGPLTFRAHDGTVTCVVCSPDGRLLATAGTDREVKIWDIASRQLVLPPLKGHSTLVTSLSFHPDGRVLASAAADKTVRLWDVATGKLIRDLRGHEDRIYGVAFSPDGKFLATAGWDRLLKLWDPDTGAVLQTLAGHSNWIWAVAVAPDGRHVATASTDCTVRVWPVFTDREPLVLRGHRYKVQTVAFHPRGGQLASAGTDRTVLVWDTETGKKLHTLPGHSERVYKLAYNPDGTRLASASEDQTVRIWDSASGAEVATLYGHTQAVRSVAFRPDTRQLASASADGIVKMWDLQSARDAGETVCPI